jgi:hypothetical protein
MSQQVATRTFDFALILGDVDEFTTEIADRLFEVGCDDATFGTSNGVHFGRFTRESGSLGEAVGSAIQDVERAGLTVSRVDVDERKG